MKNEIISLPQALFSAAAMATDLTSQVVDLRGAIGYSADFAWDTGSSLDGSLIAYASNDGARFFAVWTANVSGATGSAALNVERGMYAYVRFMWDRTDGTGNLSGSLNLKVR